MIRTCFTFEGFLGSSRNSLGFYCWLRTSGSEKESERLSLATVEVSTWPETIGGTRVRFWLPKIVLEAFEKACGILRSASQASHMASPTIYSSYFSSLFSLLSLLRTLLLAVCCFKPRSAQKRGIIDYASGLPSYAAQRDDKFKRLEQSELRHSYCDGDAYSK